MDEKNLSKDPYNEEVFRPLRNAEGTRQPEPGESHDENHDGSEEESSSSFREARADTFHLLAYQACGGFFGAVCPDGDHQPIRHRP